MKSAHKLHIRPQGLTWREIEGEVVVLDLESSNYLSLNATGSMLWRMLDPGATREDLATRLTECFGVDPDTAARDVEAFVATCREQNLLAETDAETSEG